ncbi:hypothetical protein PR202_ga05741 [Eleusine coracana subsp. coracana]|uniref:F-box domain-containing protein n=1 Tax=Eleusine coracana subsp. coracana TaxID=191504 RepID=A0AAV5BUU7_ELECO|nr:hypothetical protein QOZ80_5AG0365700 [Eleusine coracana subsp. coracana]GJM89539.1 hypothetical protein PR202_ga05741 [Eleusine coracana subsp. coracana]
MESRGGNSHRRRRRRRRRMRPVVKLFFPNDLIAEILSRVPYRSLCRFKCVSRAWLALCSDPSVYGKCPQSLSGFLYRRHKFEHRFFCPARMCRFTLSFLNTSERYPPIDGTSPLSFMPPTHTNVYLVDTCSGLLLCDRQNEPTRQGPRYFVCNPATQKWIDLPDIEPMKRLYPTIRLGFDPAVSSHFRVFLVVHLEDEHDLEDEVTGVQIYSSETGEWSYMPSEWGFSTVVRDDSTSAFFNGALHLTTLDSSCSVVTVDTAGKTWGRIPTPRHFDFIGLSQGRLYGMHRDSEQNDYELSVWVLEDYGGQRWIRKRLVKLFGPGKVFYVLQTIHPEQSLVYFATGHDRVLMSYDFGNNTLQAITILGQNSMRVYPYVPCFSQ